MPGRWLKIMRHRDGTVSYFSDKQKKWVMGVKVVPEEELKAMLEKERLGGRNIKRFYRR